MVLAKASLPQSDSARSFETALSNNDRFRKGQVPCRKKRQFSLAGGQPPDQLRRKLYQHLNQVQVRPGLFGPAAKDGLDGNRSSIAKVFLEADIVEGVYQMPEALKSARRYVARLARRAARLQ